MASVSSNIYGGTLGAVSVTENFALLGAKQKQKRKQLLITLAVSENKPK